jgi:hypothetical protein
VTIIRAVAFATPIGLPACPSPGPLGGVDVGGGPEIVDAITSQYTGNFRLMSSAMASQLPISHYSRIMKKKDTLVSFFDHRE